MMAEPMTLEEIRALFSRRAAFESWLEVEAALAETQAELGIIPAQAAGEIRNKANFTSINEAALRADIERTRAPIVSLVRALSAACAGDAGGYVHWGATTQNVIQTGRAMMMKQAHGAFMHRFDDVLLTLADMAEREAETLTVARTNQRHALPVTFGFKVAGWIEEWLRHRDRFREAAPRVFCAQWGGAVGAMHALGAQGPEVNRRLAARLGLGHMAVPSRAAQDGTAEYVLLMGLFAATCAKIAKHLYTLMADEYDEAVEDNGDEVVGSSTMPHKVNSKVAVEVIALAARLRTQVPLAFDAMQPSHEGDAACNLMLGPLIAELCPLACEMAEQMHALLTCLRLRPERMRRNLELSGEFLASENAMMALAPLLGRTRAHDIVHHAVQDADARGARLSDTLLAAGVLPAQVPESLVREALAPAAYLGLSTSMALEMAGAARRSVLT